MDAVLDLARANLARADLTPDELPADMEAVVARLEVAAIDPVPWPDLRALLKAYQEQRRALEAASPVVPVGVSREEIAKTLFERHWSAVSASPKWPGDDDGSYWLWLADAIIAALRPTDTGWRDIATAPRDGTEVLLWTGRFARAASFRRGHWYACGASRPYLRPIAHWMPLPPAPTDTGANHD